MAAEVKFSWSSPPIGGTPPSKRFGHGMVAMGNKVYVFGGAMNMDEEKVEYRNDLFVLTTGEELKWEKVAQKGEIPQAREVHVFCASDEGLVLFGGQGEDIDLFVINVFNPA
jgi:N-acetylneuraminic acid mutarotase